MSRTTDRWKGASKLLLATGIIAALIATLPIAECMFERAGDDGTRSTSSNDSSRSAIDMANEARNRSAPRPETTGYVERLTASAPACYAAHPIQENSAIWAVALIALLGAGLTRVLASGSRKNDLKQGIDYQESRSGPTHGSAADLAPVARKPEVEAIDISQELELTGGNTENEAADKDSVMAFMQEREHKIATLDEHRRHVSDGDIDGFYCPPGLAESGVLYVDPEDIRARDGFDDINERLGAKDAPFQTIAAALEAARQVVQRTQAPVQVRVAPGVYQESIELPDRVVLINHRMPVEGSVKQRLKWICNQRQHDDGERVTLLPPAEASCAISVGRGRKQGVFGCWLVGRDGVEQTGITAEGSTSLAVVHCAIESFREGGIVVKSCGDQNPEHGLNLIGSRLRKNGRTRGGAVYAQKSCLLVRKTMLHDNRARQGGAIFAADMRAPVELVDVGFRRNNARSSDRHDIESDEPQNYAKEHGHGGAAAFLRSDARLLDCKFIENVADGSGGAIAGLGARVSLRPGKGEGTEIRANRAEFGGAVSLVGWAGCAATFKFTNTAVRQNMAKESGGAVALAGLATVQTKDTSFEKNICESPSGLGGAVAALVGSRFMAKNTRFRANRSRGSGGAIGVRNAHVVLADGCIIEENIAQGGDGGGLSCETRPDRVVESLMNLNAFKLPFRCETRDVSIRNNVSLKSAGGIRAGNHVDTSSFPIKLDIQMPERVRLNEVRSPGSDLTAQILVRWAGKTTATASDIDGPLLLN